MKSLIVILCLATGMAPAGLYAETINNAKVTNLMVDKNLGDILFINLDKAHTLNTPTCHTNTSWEFALPLTSSTDEKIHSMLLTAYATGAQVSFIGTGDCAVHSNLETLRRIELK